MLTTESTNIARQHSLLAITAHALIDPCSTVPADDFEFVG